MRTTGLRGSRVELAVLAIATFVAIGVALGLPSRASAAPLSCTGTAEYDLGAHAGSLSIRVGMMLQCDEAAHLEFSLPGGAHREADTDATGAFIGVPGDAYVCAGHPQSVAVLATSGSGEWRGLITIGPEPGAPAGTTSSGLECDLLLHPSFNYITYTGPLTTPAEAFASDRFSSVLPFGGPDTVNGADHVQAVFELVPGAVPAEWSWIQWRPLAPASVSQLHLLVPGHSYVVLTNAELAWIFPLATTP